MLLALGLVLLAGTGVAGADEPTGFQIDFASKAQRASATRGKRSGKAGSGILERKPEASREPSDDNQANTAWTTSTSSKAKDTKARPPAKKCAPGPVPCKTI